MLRRSLISQAHQLLDHDLMRQAYPQGKALFSSCGDGQRLLRVDRIHQLGADNIAAFIAEPIMGAGGVLVAPEGYHRRMLDVCRANDILYIADEVVTGPANQDPVSSLLNNFRR